MFSVPVPLSHQAFAVEPMLGPSIRMCSGSSLCHGRTRLNPRIPVVWLRHAPSAYAKTSPYAGALFRWLCPSLSRVCTLRWAGPVLSLHHSQPPHPPHLRNWRYPFNSVSLHSTSQLSFRQSLRSSIPRYQPPLYIPAPAWLRPSGRHFAFLPEQYLSQHNSQFITLAHVCLRSAFLVVSQLQGSFRLTNCVRPQWLALFLLPSRSCPLSLDNVVGWTTFLICHISPQEVVNGSFSEHCPL